MFSLNGQRLLRTRDHSVQNSFMVYIDCVLDILSCLVLRFLFTFSTTCNSAVDLSEVTGKEQTDAQPSKKGRGRKQ